MKKLIPLLLLALLLCGCGKEKDTAENIAQFYYPRTQIIYGDPEGIMGYEEQVLPSGIRPLEWMLKTYLKEPSAEGLYSPFPEGTVLMDYRIESGNLILHISEPFFASSDINHTLSCACLARTCFGLTAAKQLIICSPDEQQKIVIDRDTFLYSDVSDEIHMTIGTESAD